MVTQESASTGAKRRARRSWRRRLLLAVAILAAALLGYVVSPWGPRLSPGLKADLRAAYQVRHKPHPARHFLAARYGSLDDPTHRMNAFLGFFDIERIRGLHRIVNYTPTEQRRQNIGDMAGWIAEYRESMSSAERDALRAFVSSPAGQQRIRQATSAYLTRSVEYRASTAPVIIELMTTLDGLKTQ